MKKFFLRFVVLLLVLIIAGAGVVYAFLRSALPDYTETVSLDVDEGVTVYRDGRGVAHIHGENLHDVVYAQGYVHAQERLWQMETHRRVVSGSLSEIIGEDLMGLDTLMLTLGLRRIAEELTERSSEETVSIVQRYVDGVNAWIEKDRVAPEFRILGFRPEPWTVEDAVGTVVLLAYNLGTNWREEAIRAAMREGLEPELFAEILPPYDDWDTPPIWRIDQAHPEGEEHGADGDGGVGGGQAAVSNQVSVGGAERPESPDGAAGAERPENFEGEAGAERPESPDSVGGATGAERPAGLEGATGAENPENPGYPDNMGHSGSIENSGNSDNMGNPGNLANLLALVERGSIRIPLPGMGSNSWVVSPEMSTDGMAVLANDPHLEQSLPVIWYENRLELNGEMNIYGWSIPGAPGVVIGHNDYIAWGMTNIGDSQDLFMEEQHPDDPYRFLYDGEWYEADVITEEIAVKGSDVPVEHEVIITRNGPLISNDPPMSLAWTAHDFQGSTVDAIMGMIMARNWEEFRRATYSFSLPVQNIVYADVEGNIGFRTAGQIPVRKKGTGLVPKPGWSSEYGWDGYVPPEQMPELFNPPHGYIVTANHRVAGDDYPYSIAIDCAPHYRMERIINELEAKDRFSVTDFRNMQNDWYNLHAAVRLPQWIDILRAEAEELDAPARQGINILNDWASDPVNLPDEPGPAIFQVWYLQFMEEVFREEMGDELYETFTGSAYLAYNALEYLLEKEESAWFDRAMMGRMLVDSYRKTIDRLAEEQGEVPEQWEWQQLQTISFDHVMGEVDVLRPFLCRGPYPYGGDHMTVGRAAYSLTDPFNVNSVASLRFIAVMDPDGIDACGIIVGGQSGHFMSKHYDDQLEDWLNGEYYSLTFSREELAAQSPRKTTIKPE